MLLNSKYLSILLFFIGLTNCKSSQDLPNKKLDFYVGTFTQNDKEGIYKYQIDSNGILYKVGLHAMVKNPSFLTKTTDKKTLLAVSTVNKKGTGFVYSYKIHQDSLEFKSKSKSGGGNPCFITANDEGQVLVANYAGGNVGYLKVDDQNGLTNLLDVQQHYGKGTTNRQKAPFAHSAWFYPNKKEIISVDLGTNELWFSSINNEDKFEPSSQVKLKMAIGAGPRHLTFHPNNKWIYVLNELNNTVSLVTKVDGNYKVISSISMLPNDFKEYTKAADIHISNDGKFLYATNRGHESIVIYKVNSKSGSLKLVGFESVRGKHPRNFTLTPDNEFLVVANQDTNNIISFKRNKKSGKLTFVSEIEAPKPVCVLF